jgi:hypothetical protein
MMLKKLAAAFFLFLLCAALPAEATTTCASVPNTFTNGTIIDAGQMNANFTQVLYCFNNNVAENGSNTSITSLGGLTAPPYGAGSLVFAGSTVAGTNTITVGVTNPNGYFLQAGSIVLFQAANTNTGAVTLAVGAAAATAVDKQGASGPVALVGGEIVAGQMVAAEYDGTQYELLNDSAVFIAPAFTNPTANTQANSDNSTLLATDAFVHSVAASIGPTRQTVNSGPITTGGAPNFFSATYASLSPATVNVTSSAPLVVNAAGGWNATGPNNLFGSSTSNLTWTGLTASGTDYLYVTVATNGALTTGFTTLVPIYEFYGTPSATNNQYTFVISTMTGYMGNGSTAPQVYDVFVGQMVAGSSTITSTVAYAYNGYYDSGFTATLPTSGNTSFTHNLGLTPSVQPSLILQCITNNNNYVVGDQLINVIPDVAASLWYATWDNALTAGFAVAGGWETVGKTGSAAALTAADWEYRLVVSRGW